VHPMKYGSGIEGKEDWQKQIQSRMKPRNNDDSFNNIVSAVKNLIVSPVVILMIKSPYNKKRSLL
jgi:hypothetical protein